MVYFGKLKDSNEYGFSIDTERFESYVEVADEEHMALIEKANKENKTFGADKDGNPILVDPPPLSEKVVNQNRLNELENYLKETDWYVTRFTETSAPIPDEVKEKRQQARIEISTLREELKNQNQN